jgi:hypothetical protein
MKCPICGLDLTLDATLIEGANFHAEAHYAVCNSPLCSFFIVRESRDLLELAISLISNLEE